jgi:uncharacterized membrane protein
MYTYSTQALRCGDQIRFDARMLNRKVCTSPTKPCHAHSPQHKVMSCECCLRYVLVNLGERVAPSGFRTSCGGWHARTHDNLICDEKHVILVADPSHFLEVFTRRHRAGQGGAGDRLSNKRRHGLRALRSVAPKEEEVSERAHISRWLDRSLLSISAARSQSR